ncbi:MAG: hypothetical protein H6838_20625 [Planctomycetes bacterium]|nr:hypothetical protein [Planctomycetota bacterium]MCB9887897.1 hypothetical protein [Planctomycetota bacterium]
MTERTSPPHSRLLATLCGLTVVALVAATAVTWRQSEQLQRLADAEAASHKQLEDIYAEITRIRLEQRSDQKGPEGLLAKLRAYAPMLVSARTTAPDYKNAQEEMEAILRAFETMGHDAWPFIRGRIGELKADKNFDELKWLLEAAVRVDPKAGSELLKQVLQGTLLPSARLRWLAADRLIAHDKPLAQQLLRQILETESARGVNLERAAAYNLPIPDQTAGSASGFFNFVVHYIRSEDPKMEDTLLMVIGRTEHDSPTLKECVEELGRIKSQKAIEPIERLFKNPPGRVEDPIFLNKCLDALDSIQGAAAVPFFEEALKAASTESVAKHANALLAKYR